MICIICKYNDTKIYIIWSEAFWLGDTEPPQPTSNFLSAAQTGQIKCANYKLGLNLGQTAQEIMKDSPSPSSRLKTRKFKKKYNIYSTGAVKTFKT